MNLLDINELSQKLKVPKKTIYKWTHEKKIPCLKLGKHLRFIESDIDQWLKSKEVFSRQRASHSLSLG
jgi:excisionase family DNA binding protein